MEQSPCSIGNTSGNGDFSIIFHCHVSFFRGVDIKFRIPRNQSSYCQSIHGGPETHSFKVPLPFVEGNWSPTWIPYKQMSTSCKDRLLGDMLKWALCVEIMQITTISLYHISNI